MQPSTSTQQYSGNRYPQPNQQPYHQPAQGSSGVQGGQVTQFGQQYNPNQSGSRGTVQNWSNQPQSQVTPYGQQRYGPTSGSGFSSFSTSANLLGTSLGPQPLEEYRSGDDPVYGPLAKARAKVERGQTGDVEISPDLFDLIVQTSEWT